VAMLFFLSLSLSKLLTQQSAGWVPCSTNGERHSTDTMGVSQTQCSLYPRPALLNEKVATTVPLTTFLSVGGESQTQHRQLTLPREFK
jgi:hypothetical protein